VLSSKCAICGITTKDAVAAPAVSGLGLKTNICRTCFDRFQAEAAKREAEEYINAEIVTTGGKGECVRGTRLWHAAKNREPGEVRRLAELGADLNARGSFGAATATPLMAAIGDAFSGKCGSAVPVCTTLLSLGADVNARATWHGGDLPPYAETALYWAIFEVQVQPETDVVRLLLKNGADLMLKYKWYERKEELLCLPEIARRQIDNLQFRCRAWERYGYYQARLEAFKLLLEH
jgi:hypothetical protein